MAKLKISDKDFTKLTKQSQLELTAKEQVKIHSQLDEALSAIEVLNELNTSKIKETSSASGLVNVWREDIVTPSLPQPEALQNTSHSHAGYFMIPAIFEPKDT